MIVQLVHFPRIIKQ